MPTPAVDDNSDDGSESSESSSQGSDEADGILGRIANMGFFNIPKASKVVNEPKKKAAAKKVAASGSGRHLQHQSVSVKCVR